MLDGEFHKDRQTIIRHFLVLDRASHDDIVIAFAPIVGYTFHETVDAFGEKEKPEVATPLHHLPAIRSPRVSVFQQEIRGKAGEDYLAALNLPRFVALSLDGEVEVARLPALATGDLATIHLVLAIHIAILAPRADFGASVPRIPVGVYFPVFGHACSQLCRLLLLEQLRRMVLGIDLSDSVNDDAVFVDDVGGAQRTFHHLAVHLLIAPSLVSLQNGKVGVGDQVERQLLLSDKLLMRSGTVAADAQHVITQCQETLIVVT